MRTLLSATLAGCLLAAPAAFAQDAAPPDMSAEMKAMLEAWQKTASPGAEHARLVDQFAGTWRAEQKMWMEPGGEPMVQTATAVSTGILGGRQVRMTYHGTFMGQPFEGIAHTGFDNVTGQYTNSWIDNMSTGTFNSTGTYDAATRTYTFTGTMPDPMADGAPVPIREVLRVESNDRHVMEMYETRDGEALRTMEITFTRTGPAPAPGDDVKVEIETRVETAPED
jgi:hypothetical protein